MPKIIPAILTADLDDLKTKFKQAETYTDTVQLDVMDNKFVKNISLQPEDLQGLETTLNLEVHLMCFEPLEYFKKFQSLNPEIFIFHLEATDDPASVITEIKKTDTKVGIALNPETPLEDVEQYIDQLDLVLFLSVNPGWQGQELIPEVLEKIKTLKQKYPQLIIEIDGGVKLENVQQVAESGVDRIVAGSALVKAEKPVEAYHEFIKVLGTSC